MKNAELLLLDFISVCEIVTGGKEIMIKAVSSSFKDKEDALQYYTALDHGADYFITRNVSDYKQMSDRLPVMRPKEFIDLI